MNVTEKSKQICRLCLSNGNLQSIFDSEDDNNLQYAEKLTILCTSIKVSPQDPYPLWICEKCVSRLNNSYIFKIQCEESDCELKKSLIYNETNNILSVKNLKTFEDDKFKIKIENNEILDFDSNDHSDTSISLLKSERNLNLVKVLENDIKTEVIKHDKLEKDLIISTNLLKCDTCCKEFKTKANLHRHISLHSNQKTHCCHVCGRSFALSNTLKIHMRRHTGEKPYKCSQCNATFSQPSSLKSHKRRHSGEHPFICDVCGKRFTTHGGLGRHKRTHTGERRAQCNVCGKKFFSMCYLTEHMRLHTGEKPYKCKDCSKEFISAGNLATHSRLHSNKLNTCGQCGKTCVDLQKHLRTHTDERPHQCSHCLKKFKQFSNLKYHLTIHTGERKFACTICSKKFKTNNVLKEHIHLHTGERPHKCESCDKSFRSIGARRKHCRKFHDASSNKLTNIKKRKIQSTTESISEDI